MNYICSNRRKWIAAVIAVLVIAAPLFDYRAEGVYAALTTRKQWGKEITDARLNKYNGKSYYWRLPGVNMYACTGYAEWALNSVYGIKTPSYPLVRYLRKYFIGKGNRIVAYGSHVAGRQGGNGKYSSYGEIKPGDIVFFFKRGTSGGKVKMKAIGGSRGFVDTHGKHRWTHVAVIGGRISGSHGISSRLHHNNTSKGIHYSGTIREVLSQYSSDKGATDYQVIRVIEPDEAKARIKKTYSKKGWHDKTPSLKGAVFKVAGQTLKTDKNGETPVSKAVRSGTYELKEAKAPDGFEIMKPNPKKVRLVSGKTTKFTVRDSPRQGKRPLQILKKMTANGTVIPEEKAVFRIWPQKYGKYSSKASWWKKIPSDVKDQVTTDSAGKARTKDLPCASAVFSGKYYVHQTKGPANVSLAKNRPVVLGTGTAVVKWTYNDKMSEHPSIVKKNAVTGNTVNEKGITFRLKKKGAFRKLQEHLAANNISGEDADDIVAAFLSDDPVKELSGLGVEIEGSGWSKIGGRDSFVTDAEGTAEIKKIGAGDPGEYEIYETKSPSEFKLPGYRLAAVDPEGSSDLDKPVPFTLRAVTSVTSVSYRNMPLPEIGTMARDASSGDNGGSTVENAEIIDTVNMENLEKGKAYTLFGRLMSRKTGEMIKDRKGAVSSDRFISSGASETREMMFRFDARNNAGEDLVVFERLYEGDHEEEPDNMEPLAVHEDLNDDGQTVSFPGGHTEARDLLTRGHTGSAVKDAVIKDSFFYDNLMPGEEYTVRGKLYDRETGKPFISNGKEVTSEETFLCDEKTGVIELEFRFDASSLDGGTLVVGEDLLRKHRKVFTHFDLVDKEQSISYPSIHTTASDGYTGNHTGALRHKAVIVDKVYYDNLTPGEKYTVSGYLADVRTGEPVSADGSDIVADSDSSAETVSASRSFVPEKSSGHVPIRFKLDSTGVRGRRVVVMEQLYYRGEEIASHLDKNNQDQQISYPAIMTRALDSLSGTHSSREGRSRVIDTVKYRNLIPNEKYEVRGILMLKRTGKPLMVNGKRVRAAKWFRPGKRNGSIAMRFDVSTRGMNGETIVVFEKLYRNGRLIAAHREIEDREQSVLITGRESPKTGDDQIELLMLLATTVLFSFIVLVILIISIRVRK